MKDELIVLLSKQKYLCATADVWSSRAQSYLGVTIHFINDVTFIRESYVLAFRQLSSRQTYQELGNALNVIFNEFGIKRQQITNIVTDGASSFCKMFKMLGNSIDVVVNTYDELDSDEIAVSLTDNSNSEDNVTEFMEDLNGELFVSDVLNFDIQESGEVQPNEDDFLNEEAISENDLNSFVGVSSITQNDRIELPEQRRCVSHECNLLSKDFEKKFLSLAAQTRLVKALGKLHTLWVLK